MRPLFFFLTFTSSSLLVVLFLSGIGPCAHANDPNALALDQWLSKFSDKHKSRIVIEIPSDKVRVDLKEPGDRSSDDALADLATCLDMKRADVKDIIVLRPTVFPPTQTGEKFYRESMNGLVTLLGKLSAADKQSLVEGDLLDFKALAEEQKKRLKDVVFKSPTYQVPKDWLDNRTMVFGFFFDPYVEFDTGDSKVPTRLFLRPRYLIQTYDKLVPGRRPKTYRPGSPPGERPQ
jgi:hypothetical protein